MPAWYEHVPELWNRDLVPKPYHTDSERLNAMVRLIALSAAVASLVSGRAAYAITGLVIVAIASVVHRYGRSVDREHGEMREGECAACSLPTRDNPFMNATPGELLKNPSKPPACSGEGVQKLAWKLATTGLFRSVDDVYDAQAKRHFYTMPSTTAAPDTISFAKFCYPKKETCKESPAACNPYRR